MLNVSTIRVPIGTQLVSFLKIPDPPLNVKPEPLLVRPRGIRQYYHSALTDVWAAAGP